MSDLPPSAALWLKTLLYEVIIEEGFLSDYQRELVGEIPQSVLTWLDADEVPK